MWWYWGHISPALALASNFENHNIKPVFITDVRGSSLLKSMSHYVVLSGSPSTKGFTKVINMLKIFLEFCSLLIICIELK